MRILLIILSISIATNSYSQLDNSASLKKFKLGALYESNDYQDIYTCTLLPFSERFHFISFIDMRSKDVYGPFKDTATVIFQNDTIYLNSSMGKVSLKLEKSSTNYVTNSELGEAIRFAAKYKNGSTATLTINKSFTIIRQSLWNDKNEIKASYFFSKEPLDLTPPD